VKSMKTEHRIRTTPAKTAMDLWKRWTSQAAPAR
jgi:hypothetical protein